MGKVVVMKRILSLVFIVCICSVISHRTKAQIQIHLGATTSGNATFVLDKGLSKDPRYHSTYTYKFSPIGMTFGIDLGKKFGLSLEGIMSNQGQIYQIIDAAEKISGERNIDLRYIHLPLLMKFMSKGNGAARGNFNLGPQLSILTAATESVQANAGTYAIPEGVDFTAVQKEFPTAVDNENGTYTLSSDMPSQDLLTKRANDFRNTEFQIAMAFGLDIDLSRHLFLTTQIRANYSLTDMRNGDIIESLKSGNDIFSQRANLLVGLQLGVHYVFGTTRSFKFKE
jgi:hypothetical protein